VYRPFDKKLLMSTSFNVIANGIACQFDADKEKNLLQTLENNGLEPHYHCRDGFCGACHCKVISGESEYSIEPLAFVREDEILLCCATPKSDLVLEFD
jgi:ferredoxin